MVVKVSAVMYIGLEQLCLVCSGWEETCHSKRDNGCLLGSTGFDRRMGIIFAECVLCVCVCIHAYASRMINEIDYRLNLYYSFPFLLDHRSLWMLVTRTSFCRSCRVLSSWMYELEFFFAESGKFVLQTAVWTNINADLFVAGVDREHFLVQNGAWILPPPLPRRLKGRNIVPLLQSCHALTSFPVFGNTNFSVWLPCVGILPPPFMNC